MAAMSWAERLSRVPIPEDQVVEGVARAIYLTHRRSPAPVWEQASEDVHKWTRAQATEALSYLRTLARPAK
jgi:hypothetical protein